MLAASFLAAAQTADGAHPGDLDPSFNGGQPVLLDLAKTVPRTTTCDDVAIDAAGRIVVTGTSTDAEGLNAVALARLLPNGTIDASFGAGGSQVLQLGLGSTPGIPRSSSGRSIGPRPGGGWLVMGAATGSDGRAAMLAAAFDGNGVLDPGFGSAGSFRPQPAIVAPDVTISDRGIVTADGGCLIAGFLDSGIATTFALTKVSPLGTFAPFGDVVPVGTYMDLASDFDDMGNRSFASAPLVIPGGILIAGSANDELLLVRLSSIGSLDTTFAAGFGFVRVQAGDSNAAAPGSSSAAIATGLDGEIYVAGNATDGDGRIGMVVTRFTPGGAPDITFGSGGIRRIQTATGNFAFSIVEDVIIQPDGKVLLIGTSHDTSSGMVVLRFETNGNLDPTFGSGGIARLMVGSVTSGAQGVLSPDAQSLVVTGRLDGSTIDTGIVARVLLTETTTNPGGCAAAPSIPGAHCRVTELGGLVDAGVPDGKLRKRLDKSIARAGDRLGAAETLTGRALRKSIRKALARLRGVRHVLGSGAATRKIPPDQRAVLTADADALVSEVETLLAATA